MKRMFVFLIACFLCFSTVTISYAAVPAFDNTQWLELPSGFGGGSHNYPQSTVVTYSDLKAIRLQVNSWLSEGQYKGFRGTASISYNGSTYFIQLVQGGIAYRLCNSSGGLYRTESEFDKPTTSTGSSTYDFNQTIINNHAPSSGGTITTPSVSSSWSDRNLQEKIYQSLEYIYQCVDLANGYAFRFAGLHTLFCFSGADRVADPFDSEVGLMLEKVAIGVSWLPEGLATAIYALAALLLVFLFIKIVLLIIKCISDLVLFWKK